MAAVVGVGWGDARAQSPEPLRNVVSLTASGSVEVEQDWLHVSLMTTREGKDAAAVQKQLQQIVDAALRSLKPQQAEQAMQVRSGSMGVYPRNDNEGKIKGWQGRAEIVVEGKDFARISQAAAQINDMAVSSLGFSLSKEGRQKVQEQVFSQAIENFKYQASWLAKQFGFTGYTLREVAVHAQDSVLAPRMARGGMLKSALSSKLVVDPLPVEAGKEQVSVNVSGAIQLH